MEHTIDEHGSHGGFVSRYVFSQDHKVIGLQYLITGLIMALLGGIIAVIFRSQLAWPNREVLSPEAYNSFVTMHGTLMVFWVAMPVLIGGFGNFCIPLMIGARDMAFPTLNMLSYWTFFLSSIVILVSFFVPGGAVSAGWTAYAPLSVDARFTGVNWGMSLWLVALILEFASMLMGGVNYITTIFNLRAKGLTLMRLPMLVWMEMIAAVLFMFSVGPLIAGGGLALLDKSIGTHFFRVTAEGQGDPVLWQHLFWFFGHPEVYVVLIPGLGIIAEVITACGRKALHGYKAIVYSTIAAGVLSFVVWAHHMFVAGLNPLLAVGFSITTILISIPFFILSVAFGLTLWGGSIRITSSFLFALGGYLIFIIGGVTGLFLGAQTADIYLHDTYFVVAHFHYTFFSSIIMGTIAGIYHWFPKMFGRKMNETLGKVHAVGTFIFYNLFAFPLFFLGLAGHPRRYSSALEYDFLAKYQWIHHLATGAAIILVALQIIFIYNFFKSMFTGEKAEKNPWRATTLEWLAESPPVHGNWGNASPVVENGPYEYSVEGDSDDFRPQGKLIPTHVKH
ncbi:MAG: cbb3-type cytochrome c oxidase subunit I [Planctomycetes bacterium]|nr:cbb3-type cytochrome c oxidase subunit I [Planctomycetota bacterium]